MIFEASRISSNSSIGPSYELNSALDDLKNHFGKAAIGCGLYLCNEDQTAGLIGSVQTQWDNEGLVVNKVAHRKLRADDSVGAKSALTGKKSSEASLIDPSHICINLPFENKGAALQIVSREQISASDILPSIKTAGLLARVLKATRNLRSSYGPHASDIVFLRENYPSHLLVEIDITNSTRLFSLRGKDKALELKKALLDVIKTSLLSSAQGNLELLDRDGGDNYWLKMSLAGTFENRAGFEKSFPSYLNDTLLPALKSTIQDYEQKAHQLGMHGHTPLKIALATGELHESNEAEEFCCPVYDGDALYALSCYTSQACRQSSVIVFGDDISRFTDPMRHDFQIMTPNKKTALFTDNIASLSPMA